MNTRQPTWRYVGNLGDASPLDYGGFLVYSDETGVLEDEAEALVPDDPDDEDGTYTVYRFPLDRLKMFAGYLVPEAYHTSWPHRVEDYDKWFHRDIGKIADWAGTSAEQLRQDLTRADFWPRARAYQTISGYYGPEEFGHEQPLHGLTRAEVEDRYRDEIEADWKPEPSVRRVRRRIPTLPRRERGLFPR